MAVDGRSSSGKTSLAHRRNQTVPGGRTVHTDDIAWRPAGASLVLVEGVGAGRREVAHLLDAIIWVRSDLGDIERRNTARVAAGEMSPPDSKAG